LRKVDAGLQAFGATLQLMKRSQRIFPIITKTIEETLYICGCGDNLIVTDARGVRTKSSKYHYSKQLLPKL
jgi:hypothetical protein